MVELPDFNVFLGTLTHEELEKLVNIPESASENIDLLSKPDEKIGMSTAFTSFHMTISLLRKYHEWLSAQLRQSRDH